MTHTDSTNTTNTAKTNTHNDNPQYTKTEVSYSDIMNNMEYFSVVAFLLYRMAYKRMREKCISD